MNSNDVLFSTCACWWLKFLFSKQDKVLSVCQSGNMENIEGNIIFQVPYHLITFLWISNSYNEFENSIPFKTTDVVAVKMDIVVFVAFHTCAILFRRGFYFDRLVKRFDIMLFLFLFIRERCLASLYFTSHKEIYSNTPPSHRKVINSYNAIICSFGIIEGTTAQNITNVEYWHAMHRISFPFTFIFAIIIKWVIQLFKFLMSYYCLLIIHENSTKLRFCKTEWACLPNSTLPVRQHCYMSSGYIIISNSCD